MFLESKCILKGKQQQLRRHTKWKEAECLCFGVTRRGSCQLHEKGPIWWRHMIPDQYRVKKGSFQMDERRRWFSRNMVFRWGQLEDLSRLWLTNLNNGRSMRAMNGMSDPDMKLAKPLFLVPQELEPNHRTSTSRRAKWTGTNLFSCGVFLRVQFACTNLVCICGASLHDFIPITGQPHLPTGESNTFSRGLRSSPKVYRPQSRKLFTTCWKYFNHSILNLFHLRIEQGTVQL